MGNKLITCCVFTQRERESEREQMTEGSLFFLGLALRRHQNLEPLHANHVSARASPLAVSRSFSCCQSARPRHAPVTFPSTASTKVSSSEPVSILRGGLWMTGGAKKTGQRGSRFTSEWISDCSTFSSLALPVFVFFSLFISLFLGGLAA